MDEAEKTKHKQSQVPNFQTYEFVVEEHLDTTWSEWFDGMVISHTPEGQTTITGPISDQTALIGLLLKAHHLGLTLVSVNRCQQSGIRCQQEIG